MLYGNCISCLIGNASGLRSTPWASSGPWRSRPIGPPSATWTVYAAADLAAFCSLYEGFGNGLLEAVYFKKTVVLNRYGIFIGVIEPLGFKSITLDGYLTPEAVAAARRILNGGAERYADPERNYALARRHFSYNGLRQHLRAILTDLEGVAAPALHGLQPDTNAPIKLAV